MKLHLLALAALILPAHGEVSLTIYNQNFAVVRDTVPLDLKEGVNQVRYPSTTALLEPSSVILRHRETGAALRVLEQSYRADPVSQGLLLQLNEGKEIDFLVREPNKPDRLVRGKVIRSGYTPQVASGGSRSGIWPSTPSGGASQPVIEVEGQLRFSLPGEPLFPSLGDDTILNPTLDWRIHADQAAKFEAELSYVTGGLSWEAAYNVVAPEQGDKLDITGWVTVDNQSGKTFAEAKLQLIAGDVAKLAESSAVDTLLATRTFSKESAPPPVTQQAFDEFHLYTLPLSTTLHDPETKQVEFVTASQIASQRIYIYDGAFIDPQRYRGWGAEQIRHDENYGTQSNPKIWVMREIKNTAENHLGVPLPKGRVRFYRRDDQGQLQFIGEDNIDHTAKDETLRLYTGNAFDLVGERKRTNYQVDGANHRAEESFEIKVRNRKEKESVEIRVVEHLYRGNNWEIRQASQPHTKTDAETMEFRVELAPGEEKAVTYTVRYTW